MTPEKEKLLFATYPIFDRTHERFRTGFNCEDGWFGLISEIAKWLPYANFSGLKIVGVKEKFGRIIIDFRNSDKDEVLAISNILDGYTEYSATICEQCGEFKNPLRDHCKSMNAFQPRG